GGFVVPYSPEYRAGGTDADFLDMLARRTGGRSIHDPSQAFLHDLPAAGAPRPLWPYFLALAALVFVAAVGAGGGGSPGAGRRARRRLARHGGQANGPALEPPTGPGPPPRLASGRCTPSIVAVFAGAGRPRIRRRRWRAAGADHGCRAAGRVLRRP